MINEKQLNSLGFYESEELPHYFYKRHPDVIPHSGEYFFKGSIVGYDSYELYVKDEYFIIRDLDGDSIYKGWLYHIEELEFILIRTKVI